MLAVISLKNRLQRLRKHKTGPPAFCDFQCFFAEGGCIWRKLFLRRRINFGFYLYSVRYFLHEVGDKVNTYFHSYHPLSGTLSEVFGFIRTCPRTKYKDNISWCVCMLKNFLQITFAIFVQHLIIFVVFARKHQKIMVTFIWLLEYLHARVFMLKMKRK